MSRRRDIGEFKGWNFVIAIVIFLLFGLALYHKFDFRIDPKMTDEVDKQRDEISNLDKRVEGLEKENACLQIELKKILDQIRASHKSPRPENKFHDCQKP